jgi:hypothetical protein
LLFIGTWFQYGIATAVIIIILGSLAPSINELLGTQAEAWKVEKIPLPGFIISIIILAIWTAMSGIGGAGVQSVDYLAGNAILRDLMVKDPPLVYTHPFKEGKEYYLVYYIGYYLPGALFGKITNWQWANIITWMWSYIGILISFSWFCLFTARGLKTTPRVCLAGLFFCLASGLDIIGYMITSPVPFELSHHLEWWAYMAQIPSQTSLIYWVPQQAIAAWVATLIVYYHISYRTKPILLGIPMACLPLWSPLAAIGLVPFILYTIIKKIKEGKLTQLFSLENLIGAPMIALITLSYLGSSYFNFPIGINTRYDSYWRYALLICIDILPLILIASVGVCNKMTSTNTKIVFGIASIILLILPSFLMGDYNDIVMRASIPSLLILYILCFDTLANTKNRVLLYAGLILFSLGAMTGISEMWKNVGHWKWAPPSESHIFPFNDTTNEYNVHNIIQREGNPESLFFRFINSTK